MSFPLDSTAFIRRLPKVELHLHLEGSIRPATLREMARRKGRLANETETWIEERERHGFRYAQFSDFLNAFKLLSLLLETPDDYALATTRLMEELSAQNVRYAEITLSAGVVLWKKQSLDHAFEAIVAAVAESSPKLNLQIGWIFDAVRQFGVEHAREVMRYATRFRDRGLLAFGIGGDEVRGPARMFTDVYREARDLGLRTTAHAGETAGPESVREAVEVLGAERIGHGTSAGRDPETIAMLAERRIPVEACLTSNLATGVIGSIEEYPLRRLLEAGVVVTINSDDPALFDSNLEQEMILAAERFGLTDEEIKDVSKNAIRGAFASEALKTALEAEHLQPAAVATSPGGSS